MMCMSERHWTEFVLLSRRLLVVIGGRRDDGVIVGQRVDHRDDPGPLLQLLLRHTESGHTSDASSQIRSHVRHQQSDQVSRQTPAVRSGQPSDQVRG